MSGDESEPSTSGTTNQQTSTATEQIHAAATTGRIIKLPTFWETNPKCWFLSAEIAFDANRITADAKKFAYVVGSLSEAQADRINFILQDPPQQNKYNTIKQALMDRYSITEERKLETILSKIEIGDQRPSDLLHQIQSLAEREFSAKVIKQLWIRRLPEFIQAALVPQQEKQEEDLARIADRLHDLVGSKPNHVNTVQQNTLQQPKQTHCSNDTNLEQALIKIIDRLDKLEQREQNTRTRSPRRKTFSPGRQHFFSPTADEQNYQQQPTTQQATSNNSKSYQRPQEWCWYHTRFGPRATKCSKPCGFNAPHGGIARSNSPNR